MEDTISKFLNIKAIKEKDLKDVYNIPKDHTNKLRVSSRDGYGNRQDGIYNSFYGKKHTDESKALISKKAKERDWSHLMGRKFSYEHRKNLSDAMKGKPSPRKGKTPWNKGISTSEETKKKISEAKTGVKRSAAAKKAISEAAKNRKRKICEVCGKDLDVSNYARWHGVNCKNG